MRKAFSGNLWIRILDRSDDQSNASFNQRASTWWCAPVMRVRLKRYESSAAASATSSLLERQRFGMPQAFIEIVTFANRLTLGVNDDTANQWTWAYLTYALCRQLKRTTHQAAIGFARIKG